MSKIIAEYNDLKLIADAIRNRTGETTDLTLNQMPSAIGGIIGGIILPELNNEGDSSDLLEGKQLIDGDGNVVTGTIATKTSSDLSASGATVTVPSGYYASQATKSIIATEQATPSISIDVEGKITASATQTAGYVNAGTKSATKQLTTQAAKTITPSTSSQTAVAKNVYTTGVVTVGAIPSTYIQPSGTLEITENGTHDVTDYASVTVDVASGGSGGGSVGGTCIVTMNLPANMCVFGYGDCDVSTNGSSLGQVSIPSELGMNHIIPVATIRIFNNIPIGSIFTFYYSSGIKGASISGDIEFGLANHTAATASSCSYAVCRCNGNGTISINI